METQLLETLRALETALQAPGLALLTYESAQIGADGQLERHAKRASLWQLTDGRWLLRFHQGTPA